MEPGTWLAFFVAAWAISLSPGPGAVAAMSAGLNHGLRRGCWTTIGLVGGIWVQMALVGVGLGAVIAASATAFTVLKWAGAAYLVWLGVQQWRAPAAPLAARAEAAAGNGRPVRRRDLVLRGLAINAVNPKGTMFMLAVMPQFLDLARPLAPQYLVIVATLSFTDLVVMAGYTALASRVLRSLREARHVRSLNRVFGSMFVGAGALLATFKRGA